MMILPESPDEYKKIWDAAEKLTKSEQIGLFRFLCKNDLYFLLRYVLSSKYILDPDGKPYLEHPWLFARCRDVQAAPDGHIDIWAREHFKTTIISFALTIQDVLKNPDVTIGIFSDTRPLAKRVLRQIKTELETNSSLKEWFPDILWADRKDAMNNAKWSEDEGICVKRTTNPAASTIEAWGLIDGQPTGKHFQIRVYDDVVTQDNVTTPEQMAKLVNAWELSVNLGSEGGKARYIGTRYHFHDLYHEIIKRGEAIPRVFPGLEPPDPKGGQSVLFTQEYIDGKFRSMGAYNFFSQILCNPIAGDNMGFDPEDIRYYNSSPQEEREGKTVYILVDPANEKKRTSDYTAILVVGLGFDHNYYILDMYRDRLGLHERANLLMDLHQRWKPYEVRYEKYGMQADTSYIRILQEQRKYRFLIREVGGQVRKEDRIRRLVPLFKENRIYFPEELYRTDYVGKRTNLVTEFLTEEMSAFPVGLHDDMLDALSRIAEPDIPVFWPKSRDYWKRSEDPYRDWGPGRPVNPNAVSWMGA